VSHIDNASTAGLAWRKSSFSGAQNDCIEIATTADDMIAVRDSKNPTGPALLVSKSELRAFVDGAKDGQFDTV
jgi:hypothetical protein